MDEEIPYNELLLDVEDGIVVGLYHYLWLKDGKGRACPEVNVPHTIIISNGRPKVWYFTSGKEHCIKRKNRANITNATITEALAPRPKQNPNTTSSHGYSSSAGGTSAAATSTLADPNAALLGAWGSTSQQQQQASQQQQQSQGQGGHRRNKSLEMSTSAGRVPDGTSTGTSLGPWPHHGIVARFQGSMTMPHSTGGSPTRGASLGRKKKGAQFELQDESVEFFTREQLGEILPPGHTVVHGVAALHEGVLQRFVQPRGQHHFSIRATWSPNACVVERRTSKAKLNDPRLPLVERLAAWDGPTWLSDHTLINGTVLHGSVCRLCDNVASHLAEVSGGAVRVLRMVLFFCVDEANRIWLTHCATLKTERLREHIMVTTGRFGAAPHLLGGPPRLLMRHGLSPPLLPSTAAAALRLRSPDGSRGISGGGASGGGALSGEASLDLPAPSAAFVASKSAAATDASSEAAAAAGRFLCVLTGEMYPGTQRCDVTYKQLLQHWFGLASQLPNEGDRLRAMDTIPLAIRRANPSLTREWYLRVRSQPTFLYRTAPVCLEAATQITGMALDELQRTLMPSPSAMGAVAAAAAAAVGAAAAGPAGPQHHGGASVSNPGNGLLVGWAASATQNHGSPPTTARGAMPEVLSRQNTTSTTRVQLVAVPSVRQRPATALPPAGPSGHLLPLQQPTSFRSGSRLAQQQQQAQPGAGPPRRFPMTRSKSASPSVAASRLALAPTSSGGGGGGGSGGLPSMLREKGGTAGAGLGKQHSFLQAYGPTPEQAAEAAAIAAVLPYEVLDEARQLAATEPSEAAAGAVAAAATEASSPRSNHHSHHSANRDGHGGDEDGDNIGCGGGSCRDDDGDSDGSEIDETRPNGALAGQHVVSAPNSKMAHVSGGGGSGPGSPGRRAGPGLGYATAAATAAHAGGGNSGGNYIAPRPIRVLPGRVSTSSEITEMGSVASFSDPSSPNGPHTAYHQQQSNSNPHAHAYTHGYTPTHGHTPPLAGGGGGGGGGGAGGPASSIPPSRMSPPRSAGAPTLHTIHEEGAIAAPPPPASPSKRACSPLGGPELHFPPPPRGGAGSHSVPRMRPNTRSGLDRQLVPGHGVSVGAAGRRHPGPTQMYSHSSGGASAAAAAAGSGGSHGGLQRRNSFSESGDLPALPGAAAAAAAASLNSTMASSIGSLSRRSTSNQAVLSNEDMRTLRELNEAYSAAERLTQQLLAQAHEILSEDGSSRPGSTGNSPMHGGRRPPPSPRGPTPTSRPGTGNSGLTTGVTRQASSSGSGTGGLIRVSSGSGRPGTGGTQRPSSSSLLPAPSPVPAAPSTSGSGLGPSPLGQREPYVGRSGSGRGLGHGVAGGGGGAAAATDKGLASAAAPGALPPVQNSIGSQPTAAQGAVGVGPEEASGSSGSGASLAVTGSQPYPAPRNLDLLTSAEADLLAEALQA